MNAIPAIVAGVDEIAMVVPPAADGTVNPYTLAAAAEAGVDEIYKVGGAQAVAALAYGTRDDPARRQDRRPRQRVRDRGQEARDGRRRHRHARRSLGGARPRRRDRRARVRRHRPHGAGRARPAGGDLPRDHRPRAARRRSRRRSRCCSTSRRAARSSRRSLTDNGARRRRAPTSSRRSTPSTSSRPSTSRCRWPSRSSCSAASATRARSSSGTWTPESVGDYVAGPNHVLPTGGTARFSSPLSVDDFVKKSSVLVVLASRRSRWTAPTVLEIADKEGLWAHGRAVSLRLDARRGGLRRSSSRTSELDDEPVRSKRARPRWTASGHRAPSSNHSCPTTPRR